MEKFGYRVLILGLGMPRAGTPVVAWKSLASKAERSEDEATKWTTRPYVNDWVGLLHRSERSFDYSDTFNDAYLTASMRTIFT